jgi:hypothetical protein
MSENVQCYVYDFYVTAGSLSERDIHTHLDAYCKKWVFQLERGEQSTEKNVDGYVHYQGRLSLIKKKTEANVAKVFLARGIHLNVLPTSKAQADLYTKDSQAFYQMKEDTKVAGPWTDIDFRTKPKLPYPYNEECWDPPLPWMETMLEKLRSRSKRVIHCIVDKGGCSGKTSFSMYCLSEGIAFRVPPYNDLNDIYGVVMAYPGQKGYIFDIPRSVPKGRLCGMFAGIEEIRNGYCCDKRYHFQFKTFDSPNVLVFTNKKPNLSYLSKDRWMLWQITNNALVPFVDDDDGVHEEQEEEQCEEICQDFEEEDR